MFKFILGALLLAGFAASYEYTKITKQDVKIIYPPAIALVKYKDVIYHCQGIVKTACGYSIHCNEMSVHCVNDLQVEYLQ